MPKSLDEATTYLNYIFTVFFVVEMALKLAGLGVKGYMSEGMNVFDGVVTLAGLTEMVVQLSPAREAMGNYLSVLRAFRLLRVFRLARSWKSLNRIIKVLISSVAAVSWLSLLLLLFIFMWALLGTQVRPPSSIVSRHARPPRNHEPSLLTCLSAPCCLALLAFGTRSSLATSWPTAPACRARRSSARPAWTW